MPWKAGDVDKHAKGLSPKQKRAWVKVANAALSRCEAQGESDCEGRAVRQANAVAKGIKEAEAAAVAAHGLLALEEKGRKLSARNEKALRDALATLQAVLAQVEDAKDEGVDEAAAPLILEGPVAAAHAALDEALSFSDRERAIRAALKEKFTGYCWTRDVFDDDVVFEWVPREAEMMGEAGGAERLYRVTYTIGEDGAVALGDKPQPVRMVTSYEPAPAPPAVPTAESAVVADPPRPDPEPPNPPAEPEEAAVRITGDLVPLIEKSVRRDGTVPVRVIAPGWGASGFYGADVLKRDGPKVFAKGLHSYWNHPTVSEAAERPERDLRDLAGVLESDARWEDAGPAGPGLYADLKVLGAYREAVEELAPHIGLSIRALGRASRGEAEGRTGAIIEAFEDAESLDFVTRPGAGGQVLQLFEAARASAAAQTPAQPEGGTRVNEQEAKALQESLDGLTEQNKTLRQAMTGLEEQTRVQQEHIARMNQAMLERDIRDVLTATLAEADMQGVARPDLVRQRLAESLPHRAPVKDGVLDRDAFATAIRDAVKAEVAYLAGSTGMGAGRIVGMGAAAGAVSEADEAEARAGLERTFTRLTGSESAAKIMANGR